MGEGVNRYRKFPVRCPACHNAHVVLASPVNVRKVSLKPVQRFLCALCRRIFDVAEEVHARCYHCFGVGSIHDEPCPTCKTRGWMRL